MKKKIIGMTLLFLQLSVVSLWADNDRTLVVEMHNGSSISFVLSKKPVLTFANRMLQIEVEGSLASMEIDNVSQFYFKDAATGNISVQTDGDLRIASQDNNRIVIEGINPTDKVNLYSADGRMMNPQVEYNGTRAEVSLSALPQGIYVIQISNNQPIKINKK